MKLLLAAFIMASLTSNHIHAQSMHVKEKSGNLVTYSLKDLLKLTFTAENIKIEKTTGNPDEYLLEEVRFLTFSDIIIGIDNPDRANDQASFRLFPNPVIDILTISAPPDEVLNGLLEVVNIQGVVCKSVKADKVHEIKIDMRDLNDGIYICRFGNGEGWHTEKFLKMR